MTRLLRWCVGGRRGRPPVRAFVVVVLACITVAACGGDEGSDQTGGAEDTADAGDGEEAGPPTAGPGEAGVLTGPGGQDAVIPGCDDIDVQDRLAEDEYALLLDELECVLENPDRMSPEALEAAQEAEAMALAALEEGEESTDTGEEEEPEPETEPEP